jgi:hypothetical protein
VSRSQTRQRFGQPTCSDGDQTKIAPMIQTQGVVLSGASFRPCAEAVRIYGCIAPLVAATEFLVFADTCELRDRNNRRNR